MSLMQIRRALGLAAPGAVVSIYAFSALAFIDDLFRVNHIAYGLFYTPMIATSVIYPDAKRVWILTGIATILVIVGAFFPMVDSDIPDLVLNRVLSIGAMLITALFVRSAQTARQELAEQTRRAEEAERLQADILKELSSEIRNPLHSLMGVLTLTIAGNNPDRQALRQVQNDGRRLLASIDNLIDLTQFKTRNLHIESIDIIGIARSATVDMERFAADRQIRIGFDTRPDCVSTKAVGDAWALRRILDNVLANALRLTPPGGNISVSVQRDHDNVAVSVSDSGKGLPQSLLGELDTGRPNAETGRQGASTGLVLCNRLAREMTGRLTARNAPTGGAVVSIALPAAAG